MIATLVAVLTPLAFLSFAARRLLTWLHAFQQEEYDGGRFLRWMLERRVFDRRVSAALAVLGGAALFLPGLQAAFGAALVVLFAAFAFAEKDPRRRSKKKLVLTARAKRIYFIALALCAVLAMGVQMPLMPLVWIIPVQIVPLALVLANVLLQPYENAVQKKYWQEAHDRLLELKPKTVGITGSFGKTSVKHILGHILQSAAPTLITPGSVNTPMGITRIVRERLEPRHKYFVVEMGAYGPGSIERLCRLAPPDLGIITAIGHAHYERFRSLETVAQAKFELAQAVIAKSGTVVVNEATLAFDGSKSVYNAHKDAFITCGPGGDNAVAVGEIVQSDKGLSVAVTWKGETYGLEAPLFGLHHGANMAIAFAAACALGIDPKLAVTALKTTPQIEHRLEVKPRGAGGLLIDDAYNSNPQGFESALELLALLGRGKRKILITPGMVELGEAHAREHARLGALAAERADLVLAVRPGRITDFVNAFKGKVSEAKPCIEVESFREAEDWLAANGQEGDIILIENDLPDVYESVPKI